MSSRVASSCRWALMGRLNNLRDGERHDPFFFMRLARELGTMSLDPEGRWIENPPAAGAGGVDLPPAPDLPPALPAPPPGQPAAPDIPPPPGDSRNAPRAE